jgi:hypothetical protein
MGLPTYTCPEGFAERVPDLLSANGIHVHPRPLRNYCRHAYTFRRGLATVEFSGFVEREGEPYSFFLVCGRNPLFWFFDMRLLSRVERVLRASGEVR